MEKCEVSISEAPVGDMIQGSVGRDSTVERKNKGKKGAKAKDPKERSQGKTKVSNVTSGSSGCRKSSLGLT